MQIEKGRIVDMADELHNLSSYFDELARGELRGKNPLKEDASNLSRALHRLSRKVDAFVEKLENEGLVA